MAGTCSAAVKTPSITHWSSGEGVCTSLWQTFYLETCVQRNTHQGSCAVSREAGLSLTGQQVPLEGDEWKSCTNKRSNRPLAYCPEGKGLVTLVLEEDWDTHDLCAVTICEENAYFEEACSSQNFASQAWAVVHLIAALQVALFAGSYAVGCPLIFTNCPYLLLDLGDFKQRRSSKNKCFENKTDISVLCSQVLRVTADSILSYLMQDIVPFSVECYRDFGQPFTITGDRNCILISEMMQPES